MILGYIKHLPDSSVCNAFYTALRILKIQQNAFDIVQEPYITAFSNLDTINYEAGSAKAWEKEVIFTCHEQDFDQRHFDIAQINTIKWSNDTEEQLKTFEDQLYNRIIVPAGRWWGLATTHALCHPPAIILFVKKIFINEHDTDSKSDRKQLNYTICIKICRSALCSSVPT